MGGYGSGQRPGSRNRGTTDQRRSIDVRWWARDGFLAPGRLRSWTWWRRGEMVASIHVDVAADYVVLLYLYQLNSGEWIDVRQVVHLTTTSCHFGGTRYWFRCPSYDCGRRVAMLYLRGSHYACRQCCRLAYASQRETAADRALRRADNIRRRLGGRAGILNPFPDKPKWMRWRTYSQLRSEAEKSAQRSLQDLARRLRISCRISGKTSEDA